MAYTADQLRACEGARVPDLLPADCRLLFVGINPGLQTAMTGIHFAHHSNRFWPALHRAGLIASVPELAPDAPAVLAPNPVASAWLPRRRPWPGARLALPCEGAHFPGPFPPARHPVELLAGLGIGITNLVDRATARADQLGREEIRAGGVRLVGVVERSRPRVVAILGLTTYRVAFGMPRASRGPQLERLGGAELHVLGNPSGLNAHETVERLARDFRQLAERAGIRPGG